MHFHVPLQMRQSLYCHAQQGCRWPLLRFDALHRRSDDRGEAIGQVGIDQGLIHKVLKHIRRLRII